MAYFLTRFEPPSFLPGYPMRSTVCYQRHTDDTRSVLIDAVDRGSGDASMAELVYLSDPFHYAPIVRASALGFYLPCESCTPDLACLTCL